MSIDPVDVKQCARSITHPLIDQGPGSLARYSPTPRGQTNLEASLDGSVLVNADG